MIISLIDYVNAGIQLADEEPRRDYLGASSIGHPCGRRVWYQYKRERTPPQPRQALIFDTGKRLEEMVLDKLEIAAKHIQGFELIRPCEENNWLHACSKEVPQFQGHMDAMIVIAGSLVIIVEIKSAKDSEFNNFKRKGLQEWKPQYFAQTHSYMGMKEIPNAVELVINKDSQEMHEEWLQLDAIYYAELEERARRIVMATEEPERINKNPTFYLCQQCEFKNECHG